jgi:hypothetical protein
MRGGNERNEASQARQSRSAQSAAEAEALQVGPRFAERFDRAGRKKRVEKS